MKFGNKASIRGQLEKDSTATTNFEGELAFNLDPLTELYVRAVSYLVGEPKFYMSGRESDEELIKAIHRAIEIDPEFVLKLAVYCREELHLRSVPLVLLAEFANSKKVGTVPRARKYVERVIQRADELTELVAYQLERNKHAKRRTKLPMMLKCGIAKAFNKFDEYQFSKYKRSRSEVKLRDVMFLTHPKPKNEDQRILFNKIANNTLKSPMTWEVMRSTGKMTWYDVIDNIFNKNGKVMNYMAMIRNLRNCLQDSSVTDEDVLLLCDMISNRRAVLNSKLLPFRFLSAYREIEKIDHPLVPQIMDSLECAAMTSIKNIPYLKGTTLIATDVSGSMFTTISNSSSIRLYEVGLILSMLAKKICQYSITGIFAEKWLVVNLSKYADGILSNTKKLESLTEKVGYSTNGYKAIEYLIDNDVPVDRIMLFTDTQMWNSFMDGKHFAEEFLKYQRRHNKVKLYIFDLAGYGNVMIPQRTKNVFVVSGWSESVFKFVEAMETVDPISSIKSINI